MGAGGESKGRGEVVEARAQLAKLPTASGNKPEVIAQKIDIFRKVLSHCTIGIDMSGVFMEMVNCAVSSHDNLKLKKMLYLYIVICAQQKPDLILLTINLLTKDCRDQDPTIRGLALRSLCSLRVLNLSEYLVSIKLLSCFDPIHGFNC